MCSVFFDLLKLSQGNTAPVTLDEFRPSGWIIRSIATVHGCVVKSSSDVAVAFKVSGPCSLRHNSVILLTFVPKGASLLFC